MATRTQIVLTLFSSKYIKKLVSNQAIQNISFIPCEYKCVEILRTDLSLHISFSFAYC